MNILDIANKPLPYDFYGVYNNRFKLGDTVFEAFENEDDGYRSYLETISLTDPSGIFSRVPFAQVFVQSFEDGIRLVDANTSHIWLKVYTKRSDDYYPMFRFDYKPTDSSLERNDSSTCPKQPYPEPYPELLSKEFFYAINDH